MYRQPYLPTHILYLLAIFLVSIMLLALSWYVVHYLLVTMQPIAVAVAQNLGSNSTNYNSIDTFFGNVDYWLPVVGLIALVIGVYQYSQKRGQPVFGY